MHRASVMNPTTSKMSALVLGALGLLVACGASQQQGAAPTQAPVPGTPRAEGVTMQQQVAYQDVVETISAARCDREESCNRVGPGAIYRDRADCMAQSRGMVSRDVNPASCPGGVGAVGLDRCVRSLIDGECDMPGQIAGRASDCHVRLLCIKQ